jgi:hypothetical protein
LVLAVMNYFPLMSLLVSETHTFRALVRICCNRMFGIMMASVAWRLPVSWTPAVSFTCVFVSARGAVYAAELFTEGNPANVYVGCLAHALSTGLSHACRMLMRSAGLLGGLDLPVSCGEPFMGPYHSVLALWLLGHVIGFWTGFVLALRDEMADRKEFLVVTRRDASQLPPIPSVRPMVLQMLGVQLFGFACLLAFGNAL